MKFSILIPAYKIQYLRVAVESILAQSYTDWELIVLNDCSPEDVKSLINSFQDARIKYYENEQNCGAVNVVDNWNKCLSYAAGEFVICMGDDDMLRDNALFEYHRYAEKYPSCDVFHSQSVIIDNNGKEQYVTNKRPEYESAISHLRRRFNGEEQFIGDFCFRRAALVANGGFYKLPLAWGSDDITVLINAKNKGVVNLQSPVFFYRASAVTISRTGNTELKLKALVALQEFLWDYIREEQTDYLEKLDTEGAVLKVDNYFFKRRMFTLAEDVSVARSRVFKWIWKRRQFQLSLSQIAFAFAYTFKAHKKLS